MADKLTPQQYEAVHNRGGNLLVSAAAGSGKTKVLVDRLMTYLTAPQDPANLDEFLIITYTKAAASELRGKIAAKLTERIAQEPENRHLQKQMQRLFLTKISTVHGFCSELLKDYAYKLDISGDFRVGDENECQELRTNILTELLEKSYADSKDNPDFYIFTDTQGLGRDDRLVPEIVEKVYHSARCHLNPQQWLDRCLQESQVEMLQDASETVWGRFLIEDLHTYLRAQISVLRQCVALMEKSEGLEKQILNIRSTLNQLEALHAMDRWDDIVAAGSIEYGRLVFPKKNVDQDLCERVKAARNACKRDLERKLQGFRDTSQQILMDLSQSAAGVRGLVALVRRFEQDYAAAKRSRRILDFGDLEHYTLDLLVGKSRSTPTAVAREVSKRYREILVDEYQDSNSVQDKIFEALTWEKHNCFLVGDVKQSIYQFRLADPGIFLEKYHRYLPAEEAKPTEGRKVLLSHNFRSGAEVIDGVNDVFRTCMSPEVGGLYYTDAEALREGIPHVPLSEPGVELYAVDVQEETYAEEAAFVAEKIDTMLRSGTQIRKNGELQPVRPEDIVILLRSPGSAGGYFQTALEARGIRCSSGSNTDFFQTEEIGTIRSFLQTILNPRQDIPLISTLASPIFGFTADDLALIRSKRKKGFFYDALLESDNGKAISFLKILGELRDVAKMNGVTTLLESCFRLTRLDSVYAAMNGGETKAENLQTFYMLAATYEKGNYRDLAQFLDHLNALENSGMVSAGTTRNDCVTIMSIHKSKGLEFPVVFLSNLSRKFNMESARGQILCDRELGIGLSIADMHNRVRYPSIAKNAISVKMMADSVSEELRVLYVAMTRARDRLIMTYASQHLENDLKELSLRLDFDQGALLCKDAICMGDWVLLTALQHTEAGELHAIGGKPLETTIGDHPWKIQVVQGHAEKTQISQLQEIQKQLPADAEDTLRQALQFRYPYPEATQAPSKQTATDRKGRQKDTEVSEYTKEPPQLKRVWNKPSFISDGTEGKAYGNAIHGALQYISYQNCGSEEAVAAEIRRLVDQRFLTPEQGSIVNCKKIAAFFATEIGKKLQRGVTHLREFKFSILDDGSHYGDGLKGEEILLQGVVDCALLEEDGITVVDFKTDYVTEENLHAVVQRYKPQVQTYGEALSRIYEMPIKAQYLYFFRLDRFVEV